MTVYCFRLFFLFFFFLFYLKEKRMKNNFNFYSKRETKHSCFLLLNIFSFSELISEKLCNLYRCYNLTLLYFFVVVATIISGFNFSLSLFLKSLLNTSLQTTTKKWKFLNDLCLKNCISLSSKNLAITKKQNKKAYHKPDTGWIA